MGPPFYAGATCPHLKVTTSTGYGNWIFHHTITPGEVSISDQ
jgi:hypothetical protein